MDNEFIEWTKKRLEEEKQFYMELVNVVSQLSRIYSEKDIELSDYFKREATAVNMRGEIEGGDNPYKSCTIIKYASEIKNCVVNIRESYGKIIELLYGDTTPDYINEEAVEAYELLQSVEKLAKYMREHGDNLEPAISTVCDNKLYNLDESHKLFADTRKDYAQIKAIFQNRSE